MHVARFPRAWVPASLRVGATLAWSAPMLLVVAPVAYAAYGADWLAAAAIAVAIWLVAAGFGWYVGRDGRVSLSVAGALTCGALIGFAFALAPPILRASAYALALFLSAGPVAAVLPAAGVIAGTVFRWAATALGLLVVARFVLVRPRVLGRAMRAANAKLDDAIQRFLDGFPTHPLALPSTFILAVALYSQDSTRALGTVFGYLWCASICFGVALKWLRPVVEAVADLLVGTWPYLRVMAPTIAGIAVLYSFIAGWFAAFFATLYMTGHEHFAQSSESLAAAGGRAAPAAWSFWDFLYLSVTTFPPLGYSDIRPQTPLAKALVSLESLIGTALTVVVFAAILAFLNPRFHRIDQERGEDIADSNP